MAAPPTVSLIIVNYNAASMTADLVRSVGDGADEIIVVDNASPEGPPRGLGTTVAIDAGANLGYGAGANRGAASATGDVLVVANPDIVIDGPAVRALAHAAMRPGVALVAPRFENLDGALIRSAHRRDPGLLVTLQELCTPFAAVMARVDPEWHATLLRSADHAAAREVRHVLGALIAIRRAAFDAVGGFDERFFLYREETDLCSRLWRSGWTVRHEPAVSAVHIGGASTSDPLPVAARSTALDSHYLYIRLRWGPARMAAAWVIGLLGSLSWAIAGPDRRAGAHAVRWHLGRHG